MKSTYILLIFIFYVSGCNTPTETGERNTKSENVISEVAYQAIESSLKQRQIIICDTICISHRDSYFFTDLKEEFGIDFLKNMTSYYFKTCTKDENNKPCNIWINAYSSNEEAIHLKEKMDSIYRLTPSNFENTILLDNLRKGPHYFYTIENLLIHFPKHIKNEPIECAKMRAVFDKLSTDKS